MSKKELFEFDISEHMLKNIIRVFISGNRFINNSIKNKIVEFFDSLDYTKFDIEKKFLVDVIKVVIKYRLKNSNSADDILSLFSGARNSAKIIKLLDELKLDEISTNELVDIDTFISSRLMFSFLYNENANMMNMVTKFETREYISLPSMVEEYKRNINKMHNQFKEISRRAIINDGFIISKEHINDIVMDAHDDLSAPSATIKTGIKHMNRLLGGGFQSKRLYCFFSTPGNWKSGLLLNTALWALKYNTFTAKDPTKTPLILYVTVENSLAETLERTYNHYEDNEFTKTDPEHIKELIAQEMVKEGLAFAMNYMTPLKTSVSDIEELLDDYRYKGFEPVMVVVDYLRRLKVSDFNKSQDNYINIGNIATELSTLAKQQNLVVVTASQLNRDAEKKVETAQSSNQVDFISTLGRAEVSESRRIIEEIDEGYVIFPVFNPLDKRNYLAIKSIKKRSRKTGVNEQPIFYVPFRNGMALCEDVELETEFVVYEILSQTMQSGNVQQGPKVNINIPKQKINKQTIDAKFDEMLNNQLDENVEIE